MAYSLARARNYRKSGRGVRKTLDKLRDPEIAFPIHFLSLKIDAKQKRRMWPVKTSGVWRASAIILALAPSAALMLQIIIGGNPGTFGFFQKLSYCVCLLLN